MPSLCISLGDDDLLQSCIGHALPLHYFTLADHFGAEEKKEDINSESRGQPGQSPNPQQPRCNCVHRSHAAIVCTAIGKF